MRRSYSRLVKTEEKRNVRRAFLFLLLTVVLLVTGFVFGLPAIAKFSGFLTDIKKSAQPIERVDKTPPAPPRLEPLPEATNDLQVDINGSTEPGTTVFLTLNNRQEEILANVDGEFSYNFSLNKGENKIAAYARDSSGNESQKTETFTIIFDDDPPSLEITDPENGSEYFGPKQRQVVIEGGTEEDASVTINDRLVVVERDQTFSFATTLSEGENQFTVKAEDKAGNTTEKSLTLHFTP